MRATRLAALAFERAQVGHDRISIFMGRILADQKSSTRFKRPIETAGRTNAPGSADGSDVFGLRWTPAFAGVTETLNTCPAMSGQQRETHDEASRSRPRGPPPMTHAAEMARPL